MRAEKQFLTDEYIEWINASPFFIVTEYTGVDVAHFEALRTKLRVAGAKIHVVKNSVFRVAAKEPLKSTTPASLAAARNTEFFTT